MGEKRTNSFFFLDGACMCPPLGQRTPLLCALKVNCPAVMGIGRQTGTNWHEWAWQRPLCGWSRGGRLLSVCPCRWIMCSTFSKAHRQKCQTGSGGSWARRLAQIIKGLRCSTQRHIQHPWDSTGHTCSTHRSHTEPSHHPNKHIPQPGTHTHHNHNTLHRCLHAAQQCVYSWGQKLRGEHNNRLW